MIRNGRSVVAALLMATLVILPAAADAAPATRHATAVLQNATGDTVGWALFSDTGHGVGVVVVAFGLSQGLHGLHIHTTGSCVAPAFVSAGTHFNPLGTMHGSHAGDLPNLPVGPGGFGHLVTSTGGFTLLPGQLSIFDADAAALIVHVNPDDYVTNPSGNSGARIACGVIAPLAFGSLGLSGR